MTDLSEYEELIAYWNMWLEQAQITNDKDKNTYAYGVFTMLEYDQFAQLKGHNT